MQTTCEIGQCGRRAKARKMCASHLERWRRYGDALHVPPRSEKLAQRIEANEKKCRECGECKPFSEFYRDSGRADGHKNACKGCSRASVAAWRAENPGKILEHSRAKRARRTQEQRERDRAVTAEWKRNNPENVRDSVHRRRAMKAQTAVGPINLEALWRVCSGVCPDCGADIDRRARWGTRAFASLDHVVPLACGGTHTQDNLRYVCLPCNLRKGASVTL